MASITELQNPVLFGMQNANRTLPQLAMQYKMDERQFQGDLMKHAATVGANGTQAGRDAANLLTNYANQQTSGGMYDIGADGRTYYVSPFGGGNVHPQAEQSMKRDYYAQKQELGNRQAYDIQALSNQIQQMEQLQQQNPGLYINYQKLEDMRRRRDELNNQYIQQTQPQVQAMQQGGWTANTRSPIIQQIINNQFRRTIPNIASEPVQLIG
jgi:hypothetical protein